MNKRKVTIIGAGFVGSTSAYSLIADNTIDELALIDINAKLVSSQVMDLQHAMPFWGHSVIKVGTYDDIADSQVVVITAGASQKPGETRLDLIQKNSTIIKQIIPKIFKHNPRAIVLMVTNPVDLLTYQAIKMYPKKAKQIMGSGTMLDTARLRFLLGEYFKINPQSVHAYIMGEHGDSEFPSWSTARIGSVPLSKHKGYSTKKMDAIFKKARNAAYTIIAGKQATYYGIGAGVTRVVKSILRNENSVLPVSHLLTNYHGISNICLSVPCVIGSTGVREQLKIDLNVSEKAALKKSANALKKAGKGIV